MSILLAGEGACAEALDLLGFQEVGRWDDKGAGRRAHGSGWSPTRPGRRVQGRG